VRFAIFLGGLFAIISGFLVWRRVARRYLFEILQFCAGIYALSFFAGLAIVQQISPELTDGFVPYFLPIPLVALFIAWALRGQKSLADDRFKV
jgi:hypothetical protein